MTSDNPTGADNQQETPKLDSSLDPNWVVGFVDGEGCFSVSLHRNGIIRRTEGWQLQPTFQVYQHEACRHILDELVRFFGCGRVRPKGPRSSVFTYSVWALVQLETQRLPFFEEHRPLVKRPDFEKFAEIVRSMRRKEHLERKGFERLVRLAFDMNANGKQRARTLEEILEGSSETVRQAL
jgi:hypothetical protein